MKSRYLGPALFLLLASTSSTWAAATPEQAAELLKTFQTYLGQKPGVVTVTPSGDGYDVALDVTPYVKDSQTPNLTAAIDPYKFKITAIESGKWAFSQSGPFKASATIPGSMTWELSMADMKMQGTYDSNLFVFLDSTYSISQLKTAQTNTVAESQIKTESSSTVEQIAGTSSSKDLGNGLVDSDGVMTLTGMTTNSKMEVPPDLASLMPNVNYSATATKAEYTTKITGLASRPFMDLVAWGFEHPSKELVLKDQAVFKQKLLAAIPFFNSLQSDSTFDNIKVETGYGPFAVASAGVNVGLNGAVKAGRFAEAFSYSGFKMPENLLPGWSKGLVPNTVKIGFDVSDFDVETPARKFITEMDLSKPEPVPPESNAAYMAAFAPKNSIQLNLPAGEITSDLYSITFDSTSTINFAGLPQVNAKIRMKGLEAVIAQLQQAPTEPMAQQAMAALFAAKGVSKPDGDGVVWEITVSPEGKALVNGTDLSAMLGAMTPPPQQ
jgi:hypothetical protein